MDTPKEWVVLFGGAGREGVLLRLFAEDVPVTAVVVPQQRSAKLEKAVSVLRAHATPVLEVTRTTLPDVLGALYGRGLLSVGFPYLIPDTLLALFRPALNVHPTLLPRFRGPTTAAYILINGEAESGSTVHFMQAQMDRGDVVAQSRVPLSDFDTIRSLQRKVYASEPDLLIQALNAISRGVRPQPQDERLASEFPRKRTPEDSEVDPSLPLAVLFNHIRACDPDEFPAFFFHNGQKVCIKMWRPNKPADAADEI